MRPRDRRPLGRRSCCSCLRPVSRRIALASAAFPRRAARDRDLLRCAVRCLDLFPGRVNEPGRDACADRQPQDAVVRPIRDPAGRLTVLLLATVPAPVARCHAVELPIVLPGGVAGTGCWSCSAASAARIDVRLPRDQVSVTQTAVVIAIILVAGPFYVRQAIASFEAVDGNLIAASRTLGPASARTFFRVTVPLAAAARCRRVALPARGLGEFGATIFFAGSLQGGPRRFRWRSTRVRRVT